MMIFYLLLYRKLKTTAAANVSWPLSPLTPIKVPISVSPELNSLISEELPEEESDEEYEPTFEEHVCYIIHVLILLVLL